MLLGPGTRGHFLVKDPDSSLLILGGLLILGLGVYGFRGFGFRIVFIVCVLGTIGRVMGSGLSNLKGRPRSYLTLETLNSQPRNPKPTPH